MMEIEKKILEVPKQIVLKRLRQLGAKKEYQAFIRIKYFDYPDHRIFKAKDLLRIREFLIGKKRETELTYKIYRGVRSGCKWFDELEIMIPESGSFDQMSEFFRRLGFVQTLSYEKRRTLFTLKSWKFEFDEHPKIPPLVEIEGRNPKEIDHAVHLLGLQNYEMSGETIEQLMARKYPKIPLNGLRFT